MENVCDKDDCDHYKEDLYNNNCQMMMDISLCNKRPLITNSDAGANVPLDRLVSRFFLFRKLWNETETHAPYDNYIHTLEDERVGQWDNLKELFREIHIEDGEEFEIVIRKTGRKPFPNMVHRYIKPHTYERVEKLNG